MKRIIFVLLAMGSFTFSFAQEEWSDYLTEEEKAYSAKDEDAAFETPNSKLVGKKWYWGPFQYFLFNQNGSGKFVNTMYFNENKDIDVVETRPFTWKRDGLEISIVYKPQQITRTLDVQQLKKFSLRIQHELKKENAEDLQARRNTRFHVSYISICKFDTDYIHYCRYHLTKSGYREDYDCDVYLFTEKKLNELKIRRNKELEQKSKEEAEREAQKQAEAQKKAEEKKLNEELRAMNEEAYSYAREGKLDEAIATIDKVIELQPQNPNWYDSKGEFLAKKGDKEGAKAMWEKVISLDPYFGKYNTPLSSYIQLLSYEGWHMVNDSFSQSVPFKKIRVKKSSGVPSEYCWIFFTTEPNSNSSRNNTQYGVNYFMNWIYNGNSYHDKRFKKCIDVGDGWFEYEYSQPMYFSHIQKNAPEECLQVLVEVE